MRVESLKSVVDRLNRWLATAFGPSPKPVPVPVRADVRRRPYPIELSRRY